VFRIRVQFKVRVWVRLGLGFNVMVRAFGLWYRLGQS